MLALIYDAATPVRCVEGCGNDWLTLLLAIAGLFVAVAAFIVSWLATTYSRDQRDMQRREHEAFLDQMNARAQLDLEIEIEDAQPNSVINGGVISISGLNFRVTITITIRNFGQREARDARLQLLTSRPMELMWERGAGVSALSEERLLDGQPSQTLDQVLDVPIPLSSPITQKAVVTAVFQPQWQPQPDIPLAVRARVTSDDLPEVRREVVAERLWTIRRSPPPGISPPTA